MARQRFRLQVRFWLDLHKAEESELADLIADLKQERTFSRVVRDGIRLMVDLGRGNLDTLVALFPWVEEAFYERFTAKQQTSDAALKDQLARLERLLIEQGNLPIASVSAPAPAVNGGPKPLKVSPVAAPVFDDDDGAELVIKKAKSDGLSAQNFLDSAFGLQG